MHVMELLDIARYLGALLLVLGLVGFAGLGARRFGLPGLVKPATARRLKVVETLMISPRQRLALVRRDDVEHLIFSSPDGSCLVENNIPPSGLRIASAATATSPASADARGGGGPVHGSNRI